MTPSADKPKKSEWIRSVLDFVFGFKNQRGDVLDGWLYSADEFNLDPMEFYTRVEKQLAAKKIPHMEISHVEFAEGGLLSNQRIYLRLMRERFAIDTSAAPFGSHFFFSCRIVHVPALVRLWHIVATLLIFSLAGYLLVKPLGFMFAVIAVVALLFAIVGVLRNAAAFTDLDSLLLKLPVLNTVYENWFRVETYYRVDTRTLYKNILSEFIQKAAEEVCGEKGIKLNRQSSPAPIFGELHLPQSK